MCGFIIVEIKLQNGTNQIVNCEVGNDNKRFGEKKKIVLVIAFF